MRYLKIASTAILMSLLLVGLTSISACPGTQVLPAPGAGTPRFPGRAYPDPCSHRFSPLQAFRTKSPMRPAGRTGTAMSPAMPFPGPSRMTTCPGIPPCRPCFHFPRFSDDGLGHALDRKSRQRLPGPAQ